MKHEAIRFAVGEPLGRRSGVWRVWHSGEDVYVMARSLAGVIKASLHESGDCVAGFTSEFAPQARALGMLAHGASRQTISWARRPLNEALSLLLRIAFPESGLAPLGDPKLGSKATTWIPSPPVGQIAEVSFLVGAPGIVFPTWPGSNSMGTQLIGRFILSSGEFLHIVWRHTNEAGMDGQLAEWRARGNAEAKKRLTPEVARQEGHLRMIIFGHDNDYRVGMLVEAGL